MADRVDWSNTLAVRADSDPFNENAFLVFVKYSLVKFISIEVNEN